VLTICPWLYPPPSSWSLRQSGTSEIEVLFAGQNSGHFQGKPVQVSAQPHAGVALGVAGIRDSEWARQVDPAGRFPGGNVRVADNPPKL